MLTIEEVTDTVVMDYQYFLGRTLAPWEYRLVVNIYAYMQGVKSRLLNPPTNALVANQPNDRYVSGMAIIDYIHDLHRSGNLVSCMVGHIYQKENADCFVILPKQKYIKRPEYRPFFRKLYMSNRVTESHGVLAVDKTTGEKTHVGVHQDDLFDFLVSLSYHVAFAGVEIVKLHNTPFYDLQVVSNNLGFGIKKRKEPIEITSNISGFFINSLMLEAYEGSNFVTMRNMINSFSYWYYTTKEFSMVINRIDDKPLTDVLLTLVNNILVKESLVQPFVVRRTTSNSLTRTTSSFDDMDFRKYAFVEALCITNDELKSIIDIHPSELYLKPYHNNWVYVR